MLQCVITLIRKLTSNYCNHLSLSHSKAMAAQAKLKKKRD